MRKNGEVLKWFSEIVNQDRRAMGLRERDGFVGLWVRERKRGREIRWVWAAIGDGEENFAEKLDLIVCG